MNRREIINLLVFVGIAIFQSQVDAQRNSVGIGPDHAIQSAEQTEARERLLVLKNGNVISGQIEETDKEVIVKTEQGSRLVIATEQAEFICASREEAYWGKLARTPASDLKKQVALFHWCLNQKLLTEAQNQLDILQATELSADQMDRLNRGLEYATRQEAAQIQDARVTPKTDVPKLADVSLVPSESQRSVDPRFLTPIMPRELTAPYRLVPLAVKDKPPVATNPGANSAVAIAKLARLAAKQDRVVKDLVQARLKNSEQRNSIVASSIEGTFPLQPNNPQSKIPQSIFRAAADEQPFTGSGALSLGGNVGNASLEVGNASLEVGNASLEVGSASLENASTKATLGLAGNFQTLVPQHSAFIDGIDPVFTPLPEMGLLVDYKMQPNSRLPNSSLAISNLPIVAPPDKQAEPLNHVIPTAHHPTDSRPMGEPKFAAIRSPNDSEPSRLIEENRVIQVGYSEAIPSAASSTSASPPPTNKFVAATIPELQDLTRSMPDGSLMAFRQQVENVFVRNCARCHDSKSAAMPLMHAGRYKNIPRRMSQRNLHSILHYSNRQDPLASSLLDWATTVHGGADVAGLSKDSKEFANLKKWLIMVSDHPELAAEGETSDGDSRDTDSRLQEPPTMNATRIDAQPLKDLVPQGEQESGAAPNDGFTPRDEFDPEIFNRKFGAGSK